jgi:tetratricopeptide (TPR) repeat protein
VAVVGDAYIVVRAITDNVKDDIRNGFKGVKGETSKMGREAGSAFGSGFARGFAGEAEQALKAFGKLVRQGYYLQSAIGAAVGSLSALVGGLGAFIGVAGAAASSGVALVGVMAQIKIANMVGKSAFKGISEAVSAADSAASGNTKTIKELREELQQLAFAAESAALAEQDAALGLEKARETLARVQSLPPDNRARREAELAYQQAELKYRQAKDKNKDAQDELENPKKAKAGKDPYAGLTESQKVFAKYLVSIKGRFKELNEAAAGGFLPTLQKQLEKMFSSGFFDTLVKGYEQVSAGLGRASEELGKSLFSPTAKDNIAALFESTGKNAGSFGKILGNTLNSILGLLRAADPLISRFVKFLDSKSAANAEKIQKNFVGITAFFKDAGDAAADFGKVFGNISAGIRGMITANMGPGSGGRMMLDSLRDSTSFMKQLNTGAGQFAAANYFKTTADTTMSIFRAFSGLGTILKDLGTMPENKEFWEILQGGQGSLERILRSAVETSPKLAELLVMITEIIAVFTDSEQVKAYFSLLNSIVGVFVEIISGLEGFMKFVGPAIGYMGALITAMLLFRKVTLITYGLILIPIRAYAAIQGFIMARQIIKQGLDAIEQGNAIKTALANAAVTTSYGIMGVAADVTGTKAALMWAKIGGPITLILAGLVLVTAAIVAIVAGINSAIDQAQKKATKATTNTLRDAARDATLTATEAGKIWATAVTRATDGIGNASEKQTAIVTAGVKTSLLALREIYDFEDKYKNAFNSSGQAGTGTTEEFRKQSKVFMKAFGEYSDSSAKIREVQDDIRESVVGLNKSFATLAKENIYNALGAMRAFAKVNDLTDKELLTVIRSDKALQDELVKHAKAVGYVVADQNGLVNETKLLNIVFLKNSYKARLLTLEYEKFEKQVNAVIESFGSIQDAIEKNTTTAEDSTKKFNFSGFLTTLKQQGDSALKYANNMNSLRKTLGKENADFFNDLVNQGESASGLVDSLVKGGTARMAEYLATAKKRAQDLELSKRIMMAFSDFRVIDKALEGVGANAMSRSYAKAQSLAGKSVIDLQAEFGLTDEQMLEASKKIKTGVATATDNMEISASWNKESLGQLKKEFEGEMGEYKITVSELKASGGIVGRGYSNRIKTSSFSTTGVLGPKGFYDGGLVFGQGGPRQDRIPAYLSNGEYVINAAATSKNLDILKAINSGKSVMGGNTNITVNAAPGMNEQEVASLVAQRLNFELSKGMNA